MTVSKKSKVWILIVTLFIAACGIVHIITISVLPPDKETMQDQFYLYEERFDIIADYLMNTEYSTVYIDKASIENETMFTGSKTHYQKISDKSVVEAIKWLLKNKNYVNIGKSENTVFFQKWSFLEKDRGIAVHADKKSKPVVEFLVKLEPISENGWYYYEADYEKYRTLQKS